MSAETIDVNAVVPDSIEAAEAFRTWNLDNGKLVSHNGIVWKPGEALHATCQGGGGVGYEVALVRRGVSLEKIGEAVRAHNQWATAFGRSFFLTGRSSGGPDCLVMPTVEPPDGYGYRIQTLPHETPSETCTCGIYAGTTLDICPVGSVSGKVKLWGKVVPGEQGCRAEYAYPSEFIVPPELAEDPTLVAFGVPITVDENMTSLEVGPGAVIRVNPGGMAHYIGATPGITFSSSYAFRKPNYAARIMWFAAALNLAACAFNLLTHFKVIG